MASDYDGAWKELFHVRFRELLTAYFPHVAGAVDWTPAVEFLDQELRVLDIAQAPADNRVDLLARVSLKVGGSVAIFVHIEVQSFREDEFSARLYRCHHQLRATCGGEVVTLAVLADLDENWLPTEFHSELLGCEVIFRYPVCKLLAVLAELEQREDLPAMAARAQIEALRTSRNPDKRLAARLKLTRALFSKGWSREAVRDAFLMLARMMRLPERQALTFRQQLVKLNEENAMPQLTDIEEIWLNEGIEKGIQKGIETGIETGIEKGIQKGRQGDVIRLLELRFGQIPEGLVEAVGKVTSDTNLDRLFEAAALSADIETFSQEL